jgi:FG-GAP repeat
MILLDRTPQSETLASFSTVTIDVLRPSSPSSVAVADVNGDGKLDVITNLVSVLLAK